MSIVDAMFLELLVDPQLGMVRLRMQECPRCEDERPHYFLCVSIAPRVWEYRCTSCNPERPCLELEET